MVEHENNKVNGEAKYSEQTHEPEMKRTYNIKAILFLVLSIVMFFTFAGAGIGFIGFVICAVWIVIAIICLSNIIGYEYDSICPYCGKTIQVGEDEEALDCPICNERIIVENYILLKK